MGSCLCCVSTKGKAPNALRRFNPTSPESAVDGTVQKVVGRIQAKLMIHNFVVGKREEKEKGRGWGGGWVLGAGAPGGAGGPHGGARGCLAGPGAKALVTATKISAQGTTACNAYAMYIYMTL